METVHKPEVEFCKTLQTTEENEDHMLNIEQIKQLNDADDKYEN